GWERLGLSAGMTVIVHSSLSSLGTVTGGADTVVASLLEAVGSGGTVAMPAFTPQIADPSPGTVGVPDTATRGRRDVVPLFHPDMPSEMGAIAEAFRKLPGSVRSAHPQVSVSAHGRHADRIVEPHPLGFAVGRDSPFGRLHDLGAHILLVGVGHNRNTFLHHAETLSFARRLKIRRFPKIVDGERVWVESLDVADDNGRLFPSIGDDFERRSGTRIIRMGQAACRLIPVPPFVHFATGRFDELLTQAPSTNARQR
ncbi:aminoglycoside N(3)-acetyltransferase, partial [Arthrobacter sp. 2YAF22_2]|uniref:aminoglycoside N(3)-acetyltransferase n=1 Tax=Arthrobacter sp. 2YAF22_2 TaxID=3233029 RepID=UPI003F8FBBEB